MSVQGDWIMAPELSCLYKVTGSRGGGRYTHQCIDSLMGSVAECVVRSWGLTGGETWKVVPLSSLPSLLWLLSIEHLFGNYPSLPPMAALETAKQGLKL